MTSSAVCLTFLSESDDQTKKTVLKFVDNTINKLAKVNDETVFVQLIGSIKSMLLSVHWKLAEVELLVSPYTCSERNNKVTSQDTDQRSFRLDLIAVLCSAYIDVLSAKNKKLNSVSINDAGQVAELSVYFLNNSIEHVLDSVLFTELMNKSDKNWLKPLFDKIDNEIIKLANLKLEIGLYLKCIAFYHKRLDYFGEENEKSLKKKMKKFSVPPNISEWFETNNISFPVDFELKTKRFLNTKHVTSKDCDCWLDILAGSKTDAETAKISNLKTQDSSFVDLEIGTLKTTDDASVQNITISASNGDHDDDDIWPSNFDGNEIVLCNFEIDKMPTKEKDREIIEHESVSSSFPSHILEENEIDKIIDHSVSLESIVGKCVSPFKSGRLSEKLSPIKEKSDAIVRDKDSHSTHKKLSFGCDETNDGANFQFVTKQAINASPCSKREEKVETQLEVSPSKMSPVRQTKLIRAEKLTAIPPAKENGTDKDQDEVDSFYHSTTSPDSIAECNAQSEDSSVLHIAKSPNIIDVREEMMTEIPVTQSDSISHSLRKRIPSAVKGEPPKYSPRRTQSLRKQYSSKNDELPRKAESARKRFPSKNDDDEPQKRWQSLRKRFPSPSRKLSFDKRNPEPEISLQSKGSDEIYSLTDEISVSPNVAHSLRKRVPTKNEETSSSPQNSKKSKRENGLSSPPAKTDDHQEIENYRSVLSSITSPTRTLDVESLPVTPKEQKTSPKKKRSATKSVSPKSVIQSLEVADEHDKTDKILLPERHNLRRRVAINYSEPRLSSVSRTKHVNVTPKVKKSLVKIAETDKEDKLNHKTIKGVAEESLENVTISDKRAKNFRYATRSRRSIL